MDLLRQERRKGREKEREREQASLNYLLNLQDEDEEAAQLCKLLVQVTSTAEKQRDQDDDVTKRWLALNDIRDAVRQKRIHRESVKELNINRRADRLIRIDEKRTAIARSYLLSGVLTIRTSESALRQKIEKNFSSEMSEIWLLMKKEESLADNSAALEKERNLQKLRLKAIRLSLADTLNWEFKKLDVRRAHQFDQLVSHRDAHLTQAFNCDSLLPASLRLGKQSKYDGLQKLLVAPL